MSYTAKVVDAMTLPSGFESVVFFEHVDPRQSFQQCFTHQTDAELDAKVKARVALPQKPAVGRVIDLTPVTPVDPIPPVVDTDRQAFNAAMLAELRGLTLLKLSPDTLKRYRPEYEQDIPVGL